MASTSPGLRIASSIILHSAIGLAHILVHKVPLLSKHQLHHAQVVHRMVRHERQLARHRRRHGVGVSL